MPRRGRSKQEDAVYREIGQRIAWAREACDLTYWELAQDMGIDRSTIHKIESGDRAMTPLFIIEVSHRLRVSPSYILVGTLFDVDDQVAEILSEAHPALRHSHIAAKLRDKAKQRA